jgi:hypothetical protein
MTVFPFWKWFDGLAFVWRMKALLIEDDAKTAGALENGLRGEGFFAGGGQEWRGRTSSRGGGNL